ncbi:MAG: hypothetical protein IT443_13680 [Phycisphaeraceae bacterium]|nr:hypothetical protein [Phycisphaeraceae bacterium]
MSLQAKLMFLIVASFVAGTMLLVFRQQQFESAHRLVTAHREIDQAQRKLWQLQAEIAYKLQPKTLRDKVTALPTKFRPIQAQNQESTNDLDVVHSPDVEE